MTGDGDKTLEVLYDHYKDTFAHIRERERRRDRLFIILLLLFALLILETLYPSTVPKVAGDAELAGVRLAISELPLAPLLDATWVLTLLIGLQYCQTSLVVERQYPYLHRLEEHLEGRLAPAAFAREGRAYLADYPLLLAWASFCYVILFPLIAIVGTIALVTASWVNLDYAWPHLVVCTICASALAVSFVLYRVLANFRALLNRLRLRGGGRDEA